MSDYDDTVGFAVARDRPDYGPQVEVLISLIYRIVARPGDTVVDAGAAGGLHSRPLADLVGPAGKVICIEPVIESAEGLARSPGSWGSGVLEIHNLAVLDEPGEAAFVVETSRAHSHVSDGRLVSADAQVRRVSVSTIDAIAGGAHVSFLKSDLEGADFLGLRGAKELLRRSRPFVVFEGARGGHAKLHGYSRDQFLTFFDALGYVVFDVHNRELTAASWDSDELGWEYVASPSDHPARSPVQRLLHRYWATLEERAILDQWTDCVRAVARPCSYWCEQA